MIAFQIETRVAQRVAIPGKPFRIVEIIAVTTGILNNVETNIAVTTGIVATNKRRLKNLQSTNIAATRGTK